MQKRMADYTKNNLLCCANGSECKKCTLLHEPGCLNELPRKALTLIEELETEVNKCHAILKSDQHENLDKRKPTLFADDDVKEMVDEVYNRCIDTDCDVCRHKDEIADGVCMSDMIMELWRRLFNAKAMRKQRCSNETD